MIYATHATHTTQIYSIYSSQARLKPWLLISQPLELFTYRSAMLHTPEKPRMMMITAELFFLHPCIAREEYHHHNHEQYDPPHVLGSDSERSRGLLLRRFWEARPTYLPTYLAVEKWAVFVNCLSELRATRPSHLSISCLSFQARRTTWVERHGVGEEWS